MTQDPVRSSQTTFPEDARLWALPLSLGPGVFPLYEEGASAPLQACLCWGDVRSSGLRRHRYIPSGSCGGQSRGLPTPWFLYLLMALSSR